MDQKAEAKRQTNKEAALEWLDRAKAAALIKSWSVVSKTASFCVDKLQPDLFAPAFL